MNKNALCFLLVISLLHVPIGFAQNARSLFSSGTGVTVGNKVGGAQTAAPSTSAAQEKGQANNYTGMSYSIFQEVEGGALSKVSPKKIFKTGDRIRVVVKTNRNGFISVVNIDPDGKASTISEQQAAANGTVNVPEKGFLKFVGKSGEEQLLFMLAAKPLSQSGQGKPNMAVVVATACDSPKGSTRALVADDSAGNQFNVVEANGTCATSKGSIRSVVVELVEDAGYGVVPADTLASGQILKLRIKLRHE